MAFSFSSATPPPGRQRGYRVASRDDELDHGCGGTEHILRHFALGCVWAQTGLSTAGAAAAASGLLLSVDVLHKDGCSRCGVERLDAAAGRDVHAGAKAAQ